MNIRPLDPFFIFNNETNSRPRYLMRDLHAFAAARALWQDSATALPPEHPAEPHLRGARDQLALGCHRFERPDKAAAYASAATRPRGSPKRGG